MQRAEILRDIHGANGRHNLCEVYDVDGEESTGSSGQIAAPDRDDDGFFLFCFLLVCVSNRTRYYSYDNFEYAYSPARKIGKR